MFKYKNILQFASILLLATPAAWAGSVSEPFTPKEQLTVQQETLKTGWEQLLAPGEKSTHMFIHHNSMTINKNNKSQHHALFMLMRPTVGDEGDEGSDDIYTNSSVAGITLGGVVIR